MSFWSRLRNVFRGDRLTAEIDEELESHLNAAVEDGRDPDEARRSLGPTLRLREEARDIRLIPWLDSLRADTIFGLRQLRKSKTASTVAVLSLGIAIGACSSVFRLVDTLLLRPLPVADVDRLYVFSRQFFDFEGFTGTYDSWGYPAFALMREAVRDRADLLALSAAAPLDLSIGSGKEPEKAVVQYVSGRMFDVFALHPALGRLLHDADDLEPGAGPYAVISYGYWSRRFGRDPGVVGRTLWLNGRALEIVGVCSESFTGTEPGTFVDVFVPTMMHPAVTRSDGVWLRTWAHLHPGENIEPVRARVQAVSLAFETERAKSFTGMSKEAVARYLNQPVLAERASAGISDMQRDYRFSLGALGVLVALVLLIACANVANLKVAQAVARSREMALRVAIGAGRLRLVQLVILESVLLALFSSAAGALFSWWAVPVLVNLASPPDNPIRLSLASDWRILGFNVALTLAVVTLSGLLPALRASGTRPAVALRDGSGVRKMRAMHTLIAVQVAFSFVVVLVAGMFSATFTRLSRQDLGFSANRLLVVDAVEKADSSPVAWEAVADHLRGVAGVESVSVSGWAPLSGQSWNNAIAVDGGKPSEDMAFFMAVSPGWMATLRIPFVEGRDFLSSEVCPGTAIVNEAFVRRYFQGRDPVGRTFEEAFDEGGRRRFEVVGVVRDSRYGGLRDSIPPVAFFPFRGEGDNHALVPVHEASFIVRTSGDNPLALANALRREVSIANPEFRVSNLRTQSAIVDSLTSRERLLARLSQFFGLVALALSAIGVYGVLSYSVFQRRREIGIRIALGARPGHIAGAVAFKVAAMALAGALAGLAIGLTTARFVQSLLYQVSPNDASILSVTGIALAAAVALAAISPVRRAIRTDPTDMLRTD